MRGRSPWFSLRASACEKRSLSLGANGYLIKPFSQEALQDEVWRFLQSGMGHAKPHG